MIVLKRVSSLFFVFLLIILCRSSLAASLPSYTLNLQQIKLADLTRLVFSDIDKRSFVLDPEFLSSSDVFSINWRNVSSVQVSRSLSDMLIARGFSIQQKNGITFFGRADPLSRGLLVYRPRFRSTKYLTDLLSSIAGVQALGSRGISATPEFQQAIEKNQEQNQAASSKIDRSASDQFALPCDPIKCAQLEQLLAQLDTRQAEVLIRAVVYEVGDTKGEGSAVQLAAKLLGGKLNASVGSALAGASSLRLVAGGLDLVFSALDSDSRFKSLSRPMLRVRTGTQARFSVGSKVPTLGAITQAANGTSSQSVEYRDSGTILTIQPDVHADVVDLNITQELSSFVQTTIGVNGSPTLLQRSASSQLSVKTGEVVVFAGLEETKHDQADSSLFGFFNVSSRKNKTNSEFLLFIEAQSI